jgi:hypothetical protein
MAQNAPPSTDKCKQLRELHDRLADELRVLKESMQEHEREKGHASCHFHASS